MFRLLDNYPANWFNKGYPKQGEPVPYRTGNKSDMASCFSFYDTKDGGAMFVAIVGQGPVKRGYPIIGMGKPGITKGIPRTVPDSLCLTHVENRQMSCVQNSVLSVHVMNWKRSSTKLLSHAREHMDRLIPRTILSTKHVRTSSNGKIERFGKMKGIGLTNIFKKHPSQIVAAAPCFGEHNREVLESFGYTKEEIDAMYDKGDLVNTDTCRYS